MFYDGATESTDQQKEMEKQLPQPPFQWGWENT